MSRRKVNNSLTNLSLTFPILQKRKKKQKTRNKQAKPFKANLSLIISVCYELIKSLMT